MSGGRGLSDDDDAAIDRNAKVQQEYLDRFERELIANPPKEIAEPPHPGFPSQVILVNPPPSVAQVIARAQQYGHSVWQTTQQVTHAQAVVQGIMTQERRVLGHPKTHHCEDCPPLAAMGWQPIGTLPAIGQTECGGMCYCHFEYREDSNATATKVPRRPTKKIILRRPDRPNPNDQGGGSSIPGEPIGPEPPRKPKPIQPPQPNKPDYGEDAGGPWFDANGKPIEYETI